MWVVGEYFVNSKHVVKFGNGYVCLCPTHFDFRTLQRFGVVGNLRMT